jgi:hypothetical protein
MKDRSDEQLIEALAEAELDVPGGLPLEIVSRGERMVEPLCSFLTNDDGAWGAIHALHLLGEIGSPRATGTILNWFRSEPGTDFITEVGNTVLGRLGPEAVDPILEYINDPSCDEVLRGTAADGLVEIGYRHPNQRPDIARRIVHLFQNIQTSEDPELVTWLVSAFDSIDDEAVMAEIDAAFEQGEVERFVIRKENVERTRLRNEPWQVPDIDEDLMKYFSRDNLKCLASINSDKGIDLHRDYSSVNMASKKKTKKKSGKKKRKQAKKSRKKNRK